jgi:hypothetical protein
MAIGELTKQIAQQALISATTKDPPPPPPPPDPVSAVILGQIQAMQKAVKEDEELAIFVHQGAERIRVLEIFVPSRQVAVLTGTDPERNLTRVIAAADSLQLMCKVMKVAPGAKPLRVVLITPKQKDSNA